MRYLYLKFDFLSSINLLIYIILIYLFNLINTNLICGQPFEIFEFKFEIKNFDYETKNS